MIINEFKQFFVGTILIFILCSVIPLSCKADVTIYCENFDDPYYQTTTWEESDIVQIDYLNQTYWYVGGSIAPNVPPEEFFSVKFFNRSFEDHWITGIEIFTDGRHGTGLVWLEKKFSLDNILGFMLWVHIFSEDNYMQNWPILLYIGVQDPDNETILRDSNDQGLFDKNEEGTGRGYYHRHTFPEPIQEPIILYIAVGIGIASEDNQTYYLSSAYYAPSPIPWTAQSLQPTSGFLLVGTLVSLVVVTIHFVRKKRINRINSI
ncbi:MAG: hypothetical protein ACFFC7_21220 [Candidatus Hermodarchaeota archaeon]